MTLHFKIAVALSLLFLCVPSHAGRYDYAKGAYLCFDCSPYDPCQHFEGTGYDNSESWSETLADATINEDYSSSPLEGSQSLNLIDGGDPGFTAYSFTAHGNGNTTGVHFLFKVLVDVTSDGLVMLLMDGGTTAGRLHLDTTNVLRLTHGTVTADGTGTTDVVTSGGIFHVWVEWTKDSGATDGDMALYVSSNGTKPGSPEAHITAGDDGSTGIDTIRFYADGGSTNIVVDSVLVDDAAIGSL